MSPVQTPSILTDAFEQTDGIYFPKGTKGFSSESQKQLWDEVGTGYYDSFKADSIAIEDLAKMPYDSITGKIGGLWSRFPKDKHFGTILEVGCGYGRASIGLSMERKLRCDRYIGLDLSESLLRRLVRFKQAYDFYPGAEFTVICTSAEGLPLEDSSVDLVISNAVFMHIEKPKVERLMAEVARVLKPGGTFVFNNSFHNAACPAHQFRNLTRALYPSGRNDIYLDPHSKTEVEELFAQAKLSEKVGPCIVEPNTHYMIIPDQMGPIVMPWMKTFNDNLKPTGALRDRLAYGFNAFSDGILEPQA
jgi:arsenite methyltransferase